MSTRLRSKVTGRFISKGSAKYRPDRVSVEQVGRRASAVELKALRLFKQQVAAYINSEATMNVLIRDYIECTRTVEAAKDIAPNE